MCVCVCVCMRVYPKYCEIIISEARSVSAKGCKGGDDTYLMKRKVFDKTRWRKRTMEHICSWASDWRRVGGENFFQGCIPKGIKTHPTSFFGFEWRTWAIGVTIVCVFFFNYLSKTLNNFVWVSKNTALEDYVRGLPNSRVLVCCIPAVLKAIFPEIFNDFLYKVNRK